MEYITNDSVFDIHIEGEDYKGYYKLNSKTWSGIMFDLKNIDKAIPENFTLYLAKKVKHKFLFIPYYSYEYLNQGLFLRGAYGLKRLKGKYLIPKTRIRRDCINLLHIIKMGEIENKKEEEEYNTLVDNSDTLKIT